MAATAVTNTSLKFNEAKTLPTAVAVDATDGAAVDFSSREDGRILIILENAAAAEKAVTVLAGDSIQGVRDLAITLSANEKKVITVESGRYMHVSGDNRGCVIIKGADANVKVAAIELP